MPKRKRTDRRPYGIKFYFCILIVAVLFMTLGYTMGSYEEFYRLREKREIDYQECSKDIMELADRYEISDLRIINEMIYAVCMR